jgi:hypothetical protein
MPFVAAHEVTLPGLWPLPNIPLVQLPLDRRHGPRKQPAVVAGCLTPFLGACAPLWLHGPGNACPIVMRHGAVNVASEPDTPEAALVAWPRLESIAAMVLPPKHGIGSNQKHMIRTALS